jgi:hypothetical protein
MSGRFQAWSGWKNPEALLDRFSASEKTRSLCDWYHFVDVLLGIESQDLRFRSRFRQLYGEFLSGPRPVPERFHDLHCRVQVRDGVPANLVTFTAPEQVGVVDFILDLYGDRGYVEMPDNPEGWRSLGLAGAGQPLLTAKGAHVLVDAPQPWQPLIATCAVNWVMRMQPDLLFFHSAAVGIGGTGVLIAGDKGAGKSTLSMALAAQGHKFLGDEIAAVRWQTLEIVPFRRAVSVRPGPQSRRVEKILRHNATFTEQFPDGTTRRRAEARDLFPGVVERSLPLRWVFFLRSFENSPRAEAFAPRTSDLRLLAPMLGTFWKTSPVQPMMQVAKLLSSVRCYFLHPGLPEETASLVEGIVRTT